MRLLRASLCAALAWATLCSGAYAQVSVGDLPHAPWPARTRAAPLASTDEAGLWDVSDRAEAQARHSAEINEDPELNAYLRGVACRVAGDYCGDIRLYVMERPYFNAQMAPNGYMEVWSGLLLRADDEAQLAFVLGHEIGHFGERHSLTLWRTARGRATAAMVISIGTAAVGAGFVGEIVYLGTLASVFGFSRENESEADTIGFTHAVAAGYAPHAGETLWNNLLAETAASDIEDVRKSETRASIFRTHPLSADRVDALQRLSSALPADRQEGETNRERYRAAIRPYLNAWLRAELRRRDFGQTLFLLDRLGSHGEDLGVIEFYRGEALRLRRGDGDLARAKEHYLAATGYDDAPAETWRELADLHARDHEDELTLACLQEYLTRAPNAGDRRLIEGRVARLAPAPSMEAAPAPETDNTGETP